jgi:hypothetical protein
MYLSDYLSSMHKALVSILSTTHTHTHTHTNNDERRQLWEPLKSQSPKATR